MEHPIKMDDLRGLPLFLETSNIFLNKKVSMSALRRNTPPIDHPRLLTTAHGPLEVFPVTI